MTLDDAVKTRQSIRRYKDQPVSEEVLRSILEAAIAAPSWKNSQTRRYHVIQSQEMLAQAKEQILPAFNAKNAENAPVLIVSTYEKGISGKGADDTWANTLAESWGAYDLGLADENLLLKAKDAGLGTLVMGMRDEKAIRNLLNIDENEIIGPVIALGYPDIEPPRRPRKGIEEIVKFY